MSIVRAVLFDFGGVLLRTEDRAGRRKWEARLGLPEHGLEEAVFNGDDARRASLGELPESAVWQAVAQRFKLDSDQLAELQNDFWSGDRLDEELIHFLRGLRPRCQTGLLSNAWSGARAAFTEKYGLGSAVDVMIISAEIGVAKPDPRIYHLAAQALGVLPAEAVFVDDFPQNVDGARAIGMNGIQFVSTRQVVKELGDLLADGGAR
jgi:putative hydrolase of the HAD superfamily